MGLFSQKPGIGAVAAEAAANLDGAGSAQGRWKLAGLAARHGRSIVQELEQLRDSTRAKQANSAVQA